MENDRFDNTGLIDWSKMAAKRETPASPTGGIVGFLQNAGKSIGSDFGRIGKGTANLIHEATGGAQQERDLQFKSQDEDVKMIKMLGQKMREAKTDEERNRLRNSLATISKSGDERDQAFQQRQSEIAEENDPLKGGAAVAGIGLDVLSGGTGGTILKGGLKQAIRQGLKQGAVYGGAQGALEPVKEKGGEATAEDIGGGAAVGAGMGALTGGVTSGVLGTGSKILGKVTRRGAPAQEGVEQVAEASGKPSLLTRMGKRLTESGSGLKAEPTTGGVKRLDQSAEFMSKYTGTPRQQRIAMEKDMGDLSGQVDDILSKNPTPIKGSDVRTQVQSAIDDPLKHADVDLTLPGVQKHLDSHLTKFESATSAKELNDYIKQLNPIAKRAQDKIARGVAVTDKEAAALTAKRAGDEVLSAIPEIKPLKQNMAQIFEVTPQVARAGEKSVGLPMASGLNTKAPVQALKGAQSKLGALLQGKGKKVDQEALATAFTPPEPGAGSPSGLMGRFKQDVTPASVTGTLTGPTVSRGAATMQPEQPTEPPIESSGEQPLDMSTDTGADTLDTGSTNEGVFSEANVQSLILQDLQSTGGKNVNMLLSLYKTFGEPKTAAKKPLSAEASKVVANANSGLKSLSQLQSIIDKQGGVSGGTLVPGRELFGNAGANLLGTAKYDNAAKNVLDVITRLRTGAAITANEEEFYKSQIPQAFDSPEVRAQKMQVFSDLFSSVANQTGTAGTDSQAALGL